MLFLLVILKFIFWVIFVFNFFDNLELKFILFIVKFFNIILLIKFKFVIDFFIIFLLKLILFVNNLFFFFKGKFFVNFFIGKDVKLKFDKLMLILILEIVGVFCVVKFIFINLLILVFGGMVIFFIFICFWFYLNKLLKDFLIIGNFESVNFVFVWIVFGFKFVRFFDKLILLLNNFLIIGKFLVCFNNCWVFLIVVIVGFVCFCFFKVVENCFKGIWFFIIVVCYCLFINFLVIFMVLFLVKISFFFVLVVIVFRFKLFKFFVNLVFLKIFLFIVFK